MQSKDILSVIRKRKLAWQKFHDDSKLDAKTGKTAYALHLDFEKKHYKGYPRLPSIKLPAPTSLKGIGFRQMLEKRSSFRDFVGTQISLPHLSTLLYYGSGINGRREGGEKRFYPSAGGLYPLETYVLSLHTPLDDGLYHYYVRSHLLEELTVMPDLKVREYFAQSWIGKAAFIIILTASLKRGMQKYGERAYRYMLIEAGHIGQTTTLLAPALHLQACAVGGFYDDKLNRLLDLEEGDEEVIYCIAVGTS